MTWVLSSSTGSPPGPQAPGDHRLLDDEWLEPELLAFGRQLAGADLFLLGEVRLAEVVLDVVLGDRHRRLELRRDVLGAVVDRARDRRVLALGQRDRDLGGRVGLLLDRLVDGHALVAGDDVLDALQRRVLARDRDLRELALLERRDGRVAEAVV